MPALTRRHNAPLEGSPPDDVSGNCASAQLLESQAKVWKAEPCSLQHSRPIETARDETLLKRMLLRLFGFYTRESRLLRGAKALHAAVREPANNPALYEGAARLPRL